MTSVTHTDLSIDAEGTVYRNVAGSLVRVSWALLDGTREYNKGSNYSAISRAVSELINEWEISNPTPVKGMGVTYNCGSDRYAYTVIEVLNEKTLVIQEDKIIRDMDTDGQPKAVRNEMGQIKTITKRKNGCWYEQGSKMGRGLTFMVGRRRFDMDPGF